MEFVASANRGHRSGGMDLMRVLRGTLSRRELARGLAGSGGHSWRFAALGVSGSRPQEWHHGCVPRPICAIITKLTAGVQGKNNG